MTYLSNRDSQVPYKLIIGVIFALIVAAVLWTAFGVNREQDFRIVQTAFGTVKVVDTAGPYGQWWGSNWRYPRYIQAEYTKASTEKSPTDESIRVTFNDGGTADMDTLVSFSLPSAPEVKLNLHRRFGGDLDAIETAVWAHLSNCLKASGPLMSASEHQSSRKGEFTDIVTRQLNDGLYEMRRVSRAMKDQTDDKGNPITIFATETVLDDAGKPKIAQPSPLKELGIIITQFSITESNYDKATLEQFSQKKQALLNAERSKAQRDEEYQQRLMIEEKGKREKAEFEAKALKEKAAAVIDAQRSKEVAELEASKAKSIAETNASQLFEVAKYTKQTAETAAQQALEVAKLNRQAAEEDAKRQIALAQAQEQSVKIAGAITERERTIATIEKEKAIGVAKELANVRVPSIVIAGGSDSKGGGNVNDQLLQMTLLKALKILPETPAN
jgi:hypothetical protein